jgi:hypothetical protein
MTVWELVGFLSQFDADTKVMIAEIESESMFELQSAGGTKRTVCLVYDSAGRCELRGAFRER